MVYQTSWLIALTMAANRLVGHREPRLQLALLQCIPFTFSWLLCQNVRCVSSFRRLKAPGVVLLKHMLHSV